MSGLTTIIITHCDMVMESGDFLQYPEVVPFNVPPHYDDYEEEPEIFNTLFWVRIMRDHLPFKFSEN